MKKADLIKLLQAIEDNDHAVAAIFSADGDKETADGLLAEAAAYHNMIWLLTDKEYAAKVWKNYMED